MDNKLIENWNNQVRSHNDYVYILGDISWYNAEKTAKIVSQLNGHKVLITGNHDKDLIKKPIIKDLFQEITNYQEIKYQDTPLVLSHYPIPCFNQHYYGAYHLYGHVHNSFEWNMMERVKYEMEYLYDKPCNMYNVGCMLPYMNYTPQTLNEIIKKGDFCD